MRQQNKEKKTSESDCSPGVTMGGDIVRREPTNEGHCNPRHLIKNVKPDGVHGDMQDGEEIICMTFFFYKQN